ncbi:MAG: YfhO family protein [Vicinamibacteria bacterium]|nr:YfhO family protein [Vicinamibacteria bacterium]
MTRERGFKLGGLVVAIVALAPFLRMIASGQSLFFRDLSVFYFPLRRFLLEGLALWEWRAWNPFVHEGAPVTLSAFGYPFDLLQLLIPNEFGISLFLVLHIPLAAITFMLLARSFDLPPTAAAAGALIYALGGYSLSTINLYVLTQTIAWAPLFILAFRRAVENGRPRSVAAAALTLAIMVSTTGIEVALQACLLAVVVAPPLDRPRFLRSAACAALGVALCAAVILPLLSAAGEGDRGEGFPARVVLANSVHPIGFLQVLIGGLFGDIANLSGTWWGTNFHSNGLPYFLSLYLGPTVISLAWAGATLSSRPLRRRLIGLVLLGVVIGLGEYAGWEAVLNLSGALRALRYPVKAFFIVQFAIALLAAFAIADIAEGNRAMLRRVTRTSLVIGAILAGSVVVPVLAPSASFLDGFTPVGLSAVQQQMIAGLIAADAAKGGLICLVAGVLAFLAGRERILPGRLAIGLTTLVTVDLLRCGAGLNTTVTQEFYTLSPEMEPVAAELRASSGRVFTCDPEASESYWQGRHARGAYHEAFSMAALSEALAPSFNMPVGVRTALSIDRNGLAPANRVLSPELATCRDFASIAPRLRAAGVNRVLSLDPLNGPGLRHLTSVSPARIAPVTIYIHELEGAASRFDRPVTLISDESDEIVLETTVESATTLNVLEPFAKGWRATVNGIERPITRTGAGYRAVPLDGGRNVVRMVYEPPGLRLGMGISGLAFILWLGLMLRGRRHN